MNTTGDVPPNAQKARQKKTSGKPVSSFDLHDLDSEREVLGALVRHPDDAWGVCSYLETNDFDRRGHQLIFEAIARLRQEGQAVTRSTVDSSLRATGELAEAGGGELLWDLYDQGERWDAGSVDFHAKRVRERCCARTLVIGMRDIETNALNGCGTEDAIGQLFKLTSNTHQKIAAGRVRQYATDLDLDARVSSTTWLWEKWIPFGLLTGLVGKPDAGKSKLGLDFCHRVLCGTPWPDGTPNPITDPNCKILWIDTEGSQALFRDRLISGNLPRGRFILPADDPLRELHLDDPTDFAWIKHAIADFRPPLTVIDALAGAHGKQENSNDEMKVLLRSLNDLARDNNVAIIVIHHLGKGLQGVPQWPIEMDMIRGATAIPALCRSIIGAGIPDPSRPLERAIMSVKLNPAMKAAPIGYQLDDAGPLWGEAPVAPRKRNPTDDCRSYLLAALEGGPLPSEQVEDEILRGESICGRSTYKAARESLHIQAVRIGGKDGDWFMCLPKDAGPLKMCKTAEEVAAMRGGEVESES